MALTEPPLAAFTDEAPPEARARNLALGIGGVILTVAFLVAGYVILADRTSPIPKPLITLLAIIWGVGGLLAVFTVSNWIVEQLPARAMRILLPAVFIGPAVIFLFYFLLLPAIRTLWTSFFDQDGAAFVGLANYVRVFTNEATLLAFRNNMLWLGFGASLTVIMGLLIAALADRSRFEVIAKSIIFMPVAISLVGAGIIWKFVYTVRDPSSTQIGLLNAIWVGLGHSPLGWLADNQPFNNLFLIVVVVWLQTGFAMVLFSAAIKGVPADLLDAARVDGANEIQTFMRVVVPTIMPTIITVTTTIVIFTLKIFDVVVVLTNGNFGTQVIATEFYTQFFSNRNFGLGSAIAIVLLILVLPVMVYNLRRFQQQQA
ncbi:MAG: carbohydrate ABC transporter permease [Candidatus Limnocylindria bacterium]